MTLISRRDLLLLGRGIHRSDHIPTMTTSAIATQKLESFSLIVSKKCLLEIYHSCYYCYACGSRICVVVGEEQHC
jgi:hypothetical protein